MIQYTSGSFTFALNAMALSAAAALAVYQHVRCFTAPMALILQLLTCHTCLNFQCPRDERRLCNLVRPPRLCNLVRPSVACCCMGGKGSLYSGHARLFVVLTTYSLQAVVVLQCIACKLYLVYMALSHDQLMNDQC